jgi:hypothetical protein
MPPGADDRSWPGFAMVTRWGRGKRSAHKVNFPPVEVSSEKKPSMVGGGTIEIELGGGVRVRVDAGVDEAALGRVRRALGR